MEPTLYGEAAGQTAFMGLFSGMWFLWLILFIVLIVAGWKIFTKAGKPGWYSIIPFFNSFQMFKIAGMSGWWFIALFIPFINLVATILLSVNLAKAFGKSAWYGIFLLWIFNAIGWLMLAFGSAEYQLTGSASATPAPTPDPTPATVPDSKPQAKK